jgi:hypothetical protein
MHSCVEKCVKKALFLAVNPPEFFLFLGWHWVREIDRPGIASHLHVPALRQINESRPIMVRSQTQVYTTV